MAKTAAYIRVSTTKQLDGTGPQQQRDSIVAYALTKGIPIDSFETDDETGTTEDRESIQLLLKQAQAGELTLLLVDRLDRLGRRLHVCEGLLAAFNQAGCEVRFASVEAANDTSGAGIMLRQMLGAMAEYQRTEWLSRMKQCSLAKSRQKGTLCGGTVPVGYRLENGHVVPDDVESYLVKRIFRLQAEGRNLTQTARILTAEGYKTRSGTKIKPMQVSRILKLADAYRGKVSFADLKSVANHEAIIHG